MSRAPREYAENGIYHVMFRGANKQDIFMSKRDYEKFLEILLKLKELKKFELYAYCLMTNHVHLVIKESELRDISDIMKRLIGEYTQWFNYKYERTGSLTENRYKSCVVENDEYFIHLVRYVHQNPVKGGLANIDEYPWSSYCAYQDDQVLVDKEFLFEILPKHMYKSFHKDLESDEFNLYHERAFNDEDLIEELKNMGIDNPHELQYFSPQKLNEVLMRIKEKGSVSLRCISRVTGIHRSKLI